MSGECYQRQCGEEAGEEAGPETTWLLSSAVAGGVSLAAGPGPGGERGDIPGQSSPQEAPVTLALNFLVLVISLSLCSPWLITDSHPASLQDDWKMPKALFCR